MSKEIRKMNDKVKNFRQFVNEQINQNESNDLKNFWNNYLKLVDIIDGIISEEGELSTRYWKDGLEEELDNITSTIKTIKDISDNKQNIINNFKSLIDGINGWISEGKSISRYGSLSKIDMKYFR
jgi:hypothetical protein